MQRVNEGREEGRTIAKKKLFFIIKLINLDDKQISTLYKFLEKKVKNSNLLTLEPNLLTIKSPFTKLHLRNLIRLSLKKNKKCLSITAKKNIFKVKYSNKIKLKEEYEIERLLDVRIVDEKEEFLIKWRGFSKKHNSWEPRQNIKNNEIIKDFYEDKFPAQNYENGTVETAPCNTLIDTMTIIQQYIPSPPIPFDYGLEF